MSAQVTLTEAEREALLSVSTDLDAIAAVERIVAARMAQALRDMRRLAVRAYPKGLVSTATVIADLNEHIDRIEKGEARG